MANKSEYGVTAITPSGGNATIDFDAGSGNHWRDRTISIALTATTTIVLSNSNVGDSFRGSITNSSGVARDLVFPAGKFIGEGSTLTRSVADGGESEITGTRYASGWIFSYAVATTGT